MRTKKKKKDFFYIIIIFKRKVRRMTQKLLKNTFDFWIWIELD